MNYLHMKSPNTVIGRQSGSVEIILNILGERLLLTAQMEAINVLFAIRRRSIFYLLRNARISENTTQVRMNWNLTALPYTQMKMSYGTVEMVIIFYGRSIRKQ